MDRTNRSKPSDSLVDVGAEREALVLKSKHLLQEAVRLHGTGGTGRPDELERQANAAEAEALELEHRIIGETAKSPAEIVVQAKLLAEYVGEGMLDDGRDAILANAIVRALQALPKPSA